MEALERNDSKTVSYEGGSFRESALGKGLFSVIPMCGLRRVAQRYEYGACKYGKSDAYKDGIPVSRCFDSAMRHLIQYADGDNTEDHLAACIWNCLAIMFMEENRPQFQDLPARKYLAQDDVVCYLDYTEGVYK